MSVTLNPTPPVRWILARLKQSFADPTLFSDVDLLNFINDGYGALVEQARYLHVLTTIDLVSGQQEYDLPPLCCEVDRLYLSGIRQIPVPLDKAATGLDGNYYYQYKRKIGFTNAPTGGTAYLLYASLPTPLTLDSTPIIPPEYYHLLRHYAAWRCILLQRGAEGVELLYMGAPRAQMQRMIFDQGIHQLRAETILESAPRRLMTSCQIPRLTLAAGVDAG